MKDISRHYEREELIRKLAGDAVSLVMDRFPNLAQAMIGSATSEERIAEGFRDIATVLGRERNLVEVEE